MKNCVGFFLINNESARICFNAGVLLLLCVLSAALAVSIYFFSVRSMMKIRTKTFEFQIIRNFYDFLKRSRGPILIGNQGVLYGSQLQPDRIAMIPHRL